MPRLIWRDLKELIHRGNQRYRPRSPFPIVGALGAERETHVLFVCVGHRRLDEDRIDIGTGILARDRPEVVPEQADGPGALLLHDDCGGAERPLFSPQEIISRRREKRRGSHAPDPSTIRGCLG